MAQEFSFDIVSEADMNEVQNAINMAMKEITNRFDFKGSITEIKIDKLEINILSDSEMRLNSAVSVLQSKLIKRGVELGFFEHQEPETALGGNIKQKMVIKQGLEVEKAKEINKEIKAAGLKVKTQIQEEKIRVSSPKKDTLQETMQFLKSQDFGVVLNFENFR